MFILIDFYRLLAVAALVNLIVLTPNAISFRLAKRDSPDVIRPGEGEGGRLDVGVLPANISTCAQTCILGAYVGSSVGCVHDDFSCICKSQSFHNSTLACYATSCPLAEANFASSWVANACASVGVNASDIVYIAMRPNGTHALGHRPNSTESASANAKKSPANLVAFTKASASLLLGVGLAASLIQSI